MASEGINNENPYVRARSLLMTEEVRDWINGGDKDLIIFWQTVAAIPMPLSKMLPKIY